MANDLVVFLEAHKTEILGRFPKLNEWLTPEIWFSIVQQMDHGKLEPVARENPESLLKALCTLADWGLKPDGEEAIINTYNQKTTITKNGKETEVWLPTAQAQWMYKGGIRRAVDMGVIIHAVPEIIREGDSIEEVIDHKGRHLSHHRDITKSHRKVIGAYCLFWLRNGLMDYELLDLEDIERSRKAAKTQSVWGSNYSEMAKKSAVRRGLKRMQGKRDPLTETPEPGFDAETTGERVEAPDNYPTGEEVTASDPAHEARDNERETGRGSLAGPVNVVVVVDEPQGVQRQVGDGQGLPPQLTPAAGGTTVVGDGYRITDREQRLLDRMAKAKGYTGRTLEIAIRENFGCNIEQLTSDMLPAVYERLELEGE